MQTNAIGWVEIPVTDMDRAEQFYSSYFGFSFDRQPERNGQLASWFPMDEGYGAAGSLYQAKGFTPSHEGSVAYFTAPGGSISAALATATEQGITILQECQAVAGTGEHGYYAFLEDSEGNRIGIHAMQE